MAGIFHRYNKKAKQRDFRAHVDHSLKKNFRRPSLQASVSKEQIGLPSQAEAKNVFSEDQEQLLPNLDGHR